MLVIEPLTASLFLILVGASLVYSWEGVNAKSRTSESKLGNLRYSWFRKQGLRALMLWSISCVFYTLEEGFHLPDVLILSGILATIAYTILVGMCLISNRYSTPILMVVSIVLVCFNLYLDQANKIWFFVNSGNSPMMPLFLFACLGALGARVIQLNHRILNSMCVLAALVTLAWIFHLHTFEAVFTKPLGRFETVRTIVSGSPDLKVEKNIPYYNLRPILVPVIISIIVLAYAILAGLKPFLSRVFAPIFILGRRSLEMYVLHLTLLAGLVLKGGLRPLHKNWQGDLTLVIVVGTCYGWVYLREKYSRSK